MQVPQTSGQVVTKMLTFQSVQTQQVVWDKVTTYTVDSAVLDLYVLTHLIQQMTELDCQFSQIKYMFLNL